MRQVHALRLVCVVASLAVVAGSFAAVAGASDDTTTGDPSAVTPPTAPPTGGEPAVEEPTTTTTTASTTPTTTPPSPPVETLDVGPLSHPPYVWHSNAALVELVGTHGSATSYWYDSTTVSAYGASVPVHVTCPSPTTYVTWIARMRFLPMIPPTLWAGYKSLDVAITKDGSASDTVNIPTIDHIEDDLFGDVDEISPTAASFTPYCHNEPWDAGGSSSYSLGNGMDRLVSRIDPGFTEPPPTNTPPVASFTQTPSGTGPGSVHFVSTSSDADLDALSYDWDFGDGTPHGVGSNVVHQYTLPGTFTAKLTVTDPGPASDDAQQPVVVARPTLGVDVFFPDHPNGQVPPGQDFVARVRVSAGANGVGALSDLSFVGDPLRITGGGDRVEILTVPSALPLFVLAPGAEQAFDFVLRANGTGTFGLASTVTGKDASGAPLVPTTGVRNGNVTPLEIALAERAGGGSSLDLVLRVTNASDAPLTGLQYPGTGGITLRPDLLPEQLRGGARLVSGPTPVLPSTLAPGETATATFRFEPTAVGTVVVVGEASATSAGGSPVSAVATGRLEIEGRRPTPPASVTNEQAADFLATMWANGASKDAAEVRRLHEAARDRILNGLRQAEDIDQVRLLTTAVSGLLYGWTESAVSTGESIVSGVGYVGERLATSPFSVWIDASYATLEAGQATKGGLDIVTYGVASQVANAYYATESPLPGGYVPLPGPALNGTVAEAMLDYAEAQAASEARVRQQVDDAINDIATQADELATQINTDPYGFAEKITQETGKVTGTVIVGELSVRGGSTLVGAVKGAVNAQRAEAEVLAAARRLVESSGQLEALGEGTALTAEQLEAFGGISRADGAKVQQIIADAKKKFGYDLELQARPSNPYSLELFASAEGAAGKTEVFKIKSLTDEDWILGVDRRALGKVGVYEPKLPSQAVLDGLPPDIRASVIKRYELQAGVWRDWNDPTSKLAKTFKRASKPGGDTFEFDAPTAKQPPDPNGAPPDPDPIRKTFLEVRADSDYARGNTVTLQSKPRGSDSFVDIGSDIDWQATLQVTGDTTKVLDKGQVQLWLNDQFRRRGLPFGEHGVTVNAWDWKGAGTNPGATKAWLGFILESLPPDQARSLAEVWAKKLAKADPSMTADKLLEGVVTGKFVIKFRADSITTGSTAIPRP